MTRGLLVLGMLCALAGCQTASVTEWFKEKPVESVAGEPSGLPPRDIVRSTSHTRIMTWAGPAPGETISHTKYLDVPAKGGMKSGGMDPILVRNAPKILIAAGILLLVGGVVVAVAFKPFWKIGVFGGGGVGVGLIVAGVAFESEPWLAPAILGVAFVAGCVWAFFHFRATAKEKEALATIVKGVANAGADATPVKAEIKKASKVAGTETAVKKAVAKVTK